MKFIIHDGPVKLPKGPVWVIVVGNLLTGGWIAILWLWLTTHGTLFGKEKQPARVKCQALLIGSIVTVMLIGTTINSLNPQFFRGFLSLGTYSLIVYVILQPAAFITWTFLLSKPLEKKLSYIAGHSIKLNHWLLFFLTIYYIQYKLNRILPEPDTNYNRPFSQKKVQWDLVVLGIIICGGILFLLGYLYIYY